MRAAKENSQIPKYLGIGAIVIVMAAVKVKYLSLPGLLDIMFPDNSIHIPTIDISSFYSMYSMLGFFFVSKKTTVTKCKKKKNKQKQTWKIVGCGKS